MSASSEVSSAVCGVVNGGSVLFVTTRRNLANSQRVFSQNRIQAGGNEAS